VPSRYWYRSPGTVSFKVVWGGVGQRVHVRNTSTRLPSRDAMGSRNSAPGDYAFFNSNHIPDSTIQEIRFAVDSPLEGAGFEPPVPLGEATVRDRFASF
jgi:hypothetical protein